MLCARANADEPRGNLSQNWKPFQQAKDEGQRLFAVRCSASDDAAMNENLHCLNEARWPFATRVDFTQIVYGNGPGSQFFGQQISSRDGILNSEIDADAACR